MDKNSTLLNEDSAYIIMRSKIQSHIEDMIKDSTVVFQHPGFHPQDTVSGFVRVNDTSVEFQVHLPTASIWYLRS